MEPHDTPPQRDSPPPGPATPVSPYVAALRERQAEIERREAALARREAELEQQYRLMQQFLADEAGEALRAERIALAERSADLDARQADHETRAAQLQTRAAELERLRRALDSAAEEVAERERTVERARAELQSLRDALSADSSRGVDELQRERQLIRARIEVVRRQERELESRMQKARDEIAAQRAAVQADREALAREERASVQRRSAVEADLKRQREQFADEMRRQREQATQQIRKEREALAAEFHQKRQALAAELREEREHLDAALQDRRAELAALDADFAARQAALRAAADEAQRARAALTAERAQLDAARQELERRRAEVARKSAANDAREREIEAHARTTAAQRQKLLRELEAYKARRARLETDREALQLQSAALTARAEALRADEQAARENAQRLSDATARLEADRQAAERDLAQRISELERRLAAAAEVEQTARAIADEAAQLRELAEARDAETRQAALSAELERQDTQRERALLEARIADADRDRSVSAAVLDQTRAELRLRAAELAAAERAWMAGPRRWWLRLGVLGAVAAAAAAAAWLRFETPLHRATVELLVDTSSKSPRRVAATHAAALLDRALPFDPSDSGLASLWAAALDAGRVAARPASEGPSVELSIIDAEAPRAQRLAALAAAAYATRLNAPPADERDPADYADLTARRIAAEEELRTTRTQRDECRAVLASLPPAADRDRLLEASLQARSEHTRAAAELARRRDELTAALRGDAPGGTVSAAEIDAACEADETLVQDRREYAFAAERYKAELTGALPEIIAAFDAHAAAVDRVRDAAQAQLQTRSAPEAAEALEAVMALAEGHARQLREAAAELTRRGQEIAALDAAEEVAALFDQLTALEDRLARSTSGDHAAVAAERVQVSKITETTSGGPREVVAANAVRARLDALQETQRALQAAAARMDSRSNVELDSAARQLRGLQVRIRQRRERIAEELSQAAQRAARSDFEAYLQRTRERVEQLEAQREAALLRLTDALDGLRGLEDAVLQRRRLEDRIKAADAEEGRLLAQLAALDAAIAEARRSGERPDRIAEVKPAQVTLVAGAYRERNAAIAGACAFAAVAVVGLGAMLRNPLSRRSALARAVNLDSAFTPSTAIGEPM